MVELQNQAVDADHQQDVRHVRIGDDGQQLIAPARFDARNLGAFEVELHCSALDGDFTAVDLTQQVVEIGGDQVYHVCCERF